MRTDCTGALVVNCLGSTFSTVSVLTGVRDLIFCIPLVTAALDFDGAPG